MPSSSLPVSAAASLPAATFSQQRQLLAEPLWFGLMSRDIWGFNAAKELRFLLKRSDRTCRAWASGDSEPGAGILGTLLQSPHGYQVNSWIMDGSATDWWVNIQRALRRSEAIDLADAARVQRRE